MLSGGLIGAEIYIWGIIKGILMGIGMIIIIFLMRLISNILFDMEG